MLTWLYGDRHISWPSIDAMPLKERHDTNPHRQVEGEILYLSIQAQKWGGKRKRNFLAHRILAKMKDKTLFALSTHICYSDLYIDIIPDILHIRRASLSHVFLSIELLTSPIFQFEGIREKSSIIAMSVWYLTQLGYAFCTVFDKAIERQFGQLPRQHKLRE